MPRRYLLDFEKPLVELEKQIEQIRELARDSEVDVSQQLLQLETQPCLMIDGGYPKNLDEKFQGNNIHVVKGGIVRFFNDIGWNMMELAEMQNPQREMFACFAEAMILEFEKCHTNFSWGRNNISLEKMEFIGAASVKHGFSAIGLDKHPKVLAV